MGCCYVQNRAATMEKGKRSPTPTTLNLPMLMEIHENLPDIIVFIKI
jgi:hypothetical protein